MTISNETIIEKLDSIKCVFDEFKENNKEDHEGIKKRLDHTNGTVSLHTKMLYVAIGGLSVLTFFVRPMWSDFQQMKIDNAKAQTINEEKIKKVVNEVLLDKQIEIYENR